MSKPQIMLSYDELVKFVGEKQANNIVERFRLSSMHLNVTSQGLAATRGVMTGQRTVNNGEWPVIGVHLVHYFREHEKERLELVAWLAKEIDKAVTNTANGQA